MTGKDLRDQLAERGVTVPSTGNTWPIRPALIHAAIAHPDHTDDHLPTDNPDDNNDAADDVG